MVYRHVAAGVVIYVAIGQFSQGPLAGSALHRPAGLPYFPSIIAVDGGVVMIWPKFLGIGTLRRHDPGRHEQSAFVFPVEQGNS